MSCYLVRVDIGLLGAAAVAAALTFLPWEIACAVPLLSLPVGPNARTLTKGIDLTPQSGAGEG